jgi:hypothetical protein
MSFIKLLFGKTETKSIPLTDTAAFGLFGVTPIVLDATAACGWVHLLLGTVFLVEAFSCSIVRGVRTGSKQLFFIQHVNCL